MEKQISLWVSSGRVKGPQSGLLGVLIRYYARVRGGVGVRGRKVGCRGSWYPILSVIVVLALAAWGR